MLSLERLGQITAAVDKPTASPEAESYRGMCGELIDELARVTENKMHQLRQVTRVLHTNRVR